MTYKTSIVLVSPNQNYRYFDYHESFVDNDIL